MAIPNRIAVALIPVELRVLRRFGQVRQLAIWRIDDHGWASGDSIISLVSLHVKCCRDLRGPPDSLHVRMSIREPEWRKGLPPSGGDRERNDPNALHRSEF
jgi:hypothetical protein